MEERGLVGIEARTADGEEVGRISEVLTDEESGEVTHVVVERDDQQFEVPITAISLDPEEDFAIFHADRSDEEPGDHTGDEVEPEGHTTIESAVEDHRRDGALVTEPDDPDEEPAEQRALVREDWEDESYTPDSGYPRNDIYINPDTGEEELDPAMDGGEGLGDDAAKLLDGTGLEVLEVEDGVVQITGAAATRQDLEESVEELMGLDGVKEVDTTDVDVG